MNMLEYMVVQLKSPISVLLNEHKYLNTVYSIAVPDRTYADL